MKKALLYLLALVLTVAMVALGFWQLSRAKEKQMIQQHYIGQSKIKLDLNDVKIGESNLYQQAFGVGQYLVGEHLFVDNQTFQGRAGYHVLVPFRLSNGTQHVLVNLGWIPMGASRQLKPKIALPKDIINLQGRLQKMHSKPPLWDSATPLVQQNAWQYLDLAAVQKKLKIANLAPLMLELEPNLDGVGGFARKWQVYDDHWINRHKAYALQWFSLAIAFLILCLVVEFRSRQGDK